MADTYTALARVYKAAKLNAESEQLRERLFGKIQSDGWVGRRILEYGCGIGETSCWLALNGFRVTAVDQSAAMLAQAQQLASTQGVAVDWQQGDITRLDVGTGFDLVLCINTLNEMRSIRDLEMVFQAANRALAVGKTFFFDLLTIQGLLEQWGNADRVLYDDPEALTVLVRSRFSFETSANSRAYIIYWHDGEHWQREDETHVLRGYALQAVGALLQRAGFQVQSVINPHLALFDPYNDQTGRAIFIALKERELEPS